MANFLAPIINDQQEDANGAPLSGGTVEVYLAGTSTPATTYSDKAGLVPNTWPIVLNTLGVNNQGAVWLTGGAAYKFIIKNSIGVVQRTIDSVSGINDSTIATDQWVVFQASPTFVSATSFSVAGDQTQTFQVGRRVRTQNTGGLVYGTITASVFSAGNTTVTVRNDSGVMDSGLSQVSYGVISVQNSSVTGLLLNVRAITSTQVYTPTPGTTKVVVEVWGGGGGGGGGAATGAGQMSLGGGGGAGGYAMSLISSAFSGVTVTIGAGGANGGIGTAGGTGGTAAFGALVTATGGAGGLSSAANANPFTTGGVGGTGSGGSVLNLSGQAGSNAFGSFSVTYSTSGMGGTGTKGSAGAGVVVANASGNTAGSSGTGFGTGGSGAATGQSQGGASGGTGAPALCVVYEYA